MYTATITLDILGEIIPVVNETGDNEELVLGISFKVLGRDIPATRSEPADHAEIEIEEVSILTVNKQQLEVSKKDTGRIIQYLGIYRPNLADRFETACWEELDRLSDNN